MVVDTTNPEPRVVLLLDACAQVASSAGPVPRKAQRVGGNPHNNDQSHESNCPKSNDFQGFQPRVTYYGYRWYDPQSGRWPSRDPIEEQGHLLIKYASSPTSDSSNPIGTITLSWGEPSGTEDSLSTYLAMSNNCLHRYDPHGEKWLECPAGKWRCWNGTKWNDWERGGDGCSVPRSAYKALEALGADPPDDPRRKPNGDDTFNNEPVIGVNFNTCGACRNHDKCFETCHPAIDVFSEFWTCQSNFKKRLLECCKEGFESGRIDKKRYAVCKRVAHAYATATNHGGFEPYRAAQHKRCGECGTCPCKQPNEPKDWNKHHRPPYRGGA